MPLMKDRLIYLMYGVHSWSGLLFGWLLFAVFLTGTLTIFDAEITAWMQPALRVASIPAGNLNGTPHHGTALRFQAEHGLGEVLLDRPSILMVKLHDQRTFSGQTIDPSTGNMVIFPDTQGGEFFYHFHSGLLLGLPGTWIVGTAGMAMLVTLGTGVVIHRRIVKDVWTFRPQAVLRRAWLDVHNMTGILVLPFPLMIAVTGLMLCWSIAMPSTLKFLTGGNRTLSVLTDLHYAQFESTALRWLYFVMGLAASAMIATGLVLWTTRRRATLAERSQTTGSRLVDSLNVATVTGLLVAIAAFFWANRILPLALPARALWEVRCLFLVWLLCLVHSLLRRGSSAAWTEQLYGAACLLGLLPLLNGLTTQSHLLVTVPTGQWALASVDLTAVAAGGVLGWMARRFSRAGLDIAASQLAPMARSDAESKQ